MPRPSQTFRRIIRLGLLFLLSLGIVSSCFAAELTVTEGSTQHVFTQKELHQRLHLQAIHVQDPVYGKHKFYAGYWLSDILELAQIHPSTKNILIFSALDGYQARISFADLIKSHAKALVAIKDLDAPKGWEKIRQGKEWLSPGPFYLVWQAPPKLKTKLPWPYQMIAVNVRDVNDAQERLFPADGQRIPSVVRGFKVFSQNCAACHSINLEGGVVGPELNVPRNILEYQDRKFLREFIGDPSAFQAKNKMPAFNSSLSSQQIEDVLNYLAWMGKHKIVSR